MCEQESSDELFLANQLETRPLTVTMQTIGTRTAILALALIMLMGLSACGSKDGTKAATQVAAKVNSEEISVHQINFALAHGDYRAVPAEQVPKLRREILDKLVDQQLAVEQALAKKLDRSPDVVMALETARRDILARAYVDQLTSGLSKPTAEETKKYFDEHPQLFAQRRIFNIQEIVLPSSPGTAAELNTMLGAGKPMQEIADWLKEKDIKFTGGNATRPAEQIPLELLPKIHGLKDGQGLVIETPKTTTVMRLVASESAPVPEAAAMPRIEQFLGNQRAGEAVKSEFKQIKDKAKISYLGEFTTSEAAAPAPVAKTETPVTADKASANSSMEKGVAGLK